jgi:hypothetical protein
MGDPKTRLATKEMEAFVLGKGVAPGAGRVDPV